MIKPLVMLGMVSYTFRACGMQKVLQPRACNPGVHVNLASEFLTVGHKEAATAPKDKRILRTALWRVLHLLAWRELPINDAPCS